MKTIIFLIFFLVYVSVEGQRIYTFPDTLVYSIEYSSSQHQRIDTIQLITTGKIWHRDSSQLESIYLYGHKLDPKYFPNLKSIGWVNRDTTGVIHNQTKCFIHPPRHNHLRIMELSPFPRIHFPLKVGKKFALMLVIGDGWEELSFTQIMWAYEVVNENNGIWTIRASSTPKSIPNINRLTFKFSLKQGFIQLNYLFYNGVIINMVKLD